MLTRDQLIEAYEKAIAEEAQPQAGDDVRSADDALNDAIMNYVTAIQFETFLWAYDLGFKHGKEGGGNE